MRRTSELGLSRAGRGRQRGFTLVELVAVMAITAIVGAIVATFVRIPLQQYVDAERRATIVDAADTAFTRIKRDLQRSLPNSVRVSTASGIYYIEFLQTRTGGRYRGDLPSAVPATSASTCPDADADGTADENAMLIGVADTCFSTIGAVPDFATIVPNQDFLVIYNLGPGFSSADAYASGNATGGNKALITAVAAGAGGENVFQFQSNTFNLDSPGRHFQVISGPVTFVCDPSAHTLTRISGYSITATQATPPVGGTSVLLAKDISGCTITYDQNVINQRVGIVSFWIQMSDAGGAMTANLFQQVQVSNVP